MTIQASKRTAWAPTPDDSTDGIPDTDVMPWRQKEPCRGLRLVIAKSTSTSRKSDAVEPRRRPRQGVGESARTDPGPVVLGPSLSSTAKRATRSPRRAVRHLRPRRRAQLRSARNSAPPASAGTARPLLVCACPPRVAAQVLPRLRTCPWLTRPPRLCPSLAPSPIPSLSTSGAAGPCHGKY